MVEKEICLGCNCIPECLDMDAKAVLWINDYYMNKAKELHLYSEDAEQYVMPKFWQTKEEFCDAKDYCLRVYKTVITKLALQLDLIHHTAFNELGWNVILWHWLEGYIEAFYDKYVRIKYALDIYPDLYVKEKEAWYIPRENDLPDDEVLQAQQYCDAYHFIYNNALTDTYGKKYEIVEHKLPEIRYNSESDKSIKHTIAKTLQNMICKKKVALYLGTHYLAVSKTTLELLSRGRIRRLELQQKEIQYHNVSEGMRRGLKRSVDYGDAFINFVYDCIWKHIPMEFVEDFQNHYEIYQRYHLKMPTKVVDSTMIYNDILFKIFVAEALSCGSKLEMIQHGGNYCVEKYIRWWEFDIADKYYTWGNGFIKNNKGNMYAMPLPKTLHVKRRNRGNVLFVGCTYRPFVSCFWNLYTMKMEKLYKAEDSFFRSLQQKSQRILRVRCYPVDPWWNRKKILMRKFPWMQFDDSPNYYTSMSESGLVVTSIISTTCMESINCNIPTIIFCSDDFFIPDENAIEILNELRRVKVLFDNPEDAADFINNNLESIDKWWNEPERKAVVGRFRNMYASRGHFPKLKWIREMLKESKAV